MRVWNNQGQELYVGATGATGPTGGGQMYVGRTTANASGTLVTFTSPFPAILDAVNGDYTVSVQGRDGSGNIVPVRYTRIPASMTLYPDFDGTIVEWSAIQRTQ